ncbi:MAG: hypothetical protein ACTSU2_17510 [Promethearchaeota archaeon]
MPKGFVITRWTEEDGLILETNWPSSIEVDLDDMMRIFYAHITGTAEAGNVFLRLEKMRCNVFSYFTGMDAQIPIIINLLLDYSENPEMFGESVINEINQTIIKHMYSMGEKAAAHLKLIGKLEDFLKKSLDLLERLSNLSKEQTFAQIYSSEKARNMMEILRDKPLSRKQLQLAIEEKLDKSVANIDYALELLFKTGIIAQDWLQGETDIYFFMIKDFAIFRAPSKKNIERALNKIPSPYLADEYLKRVKDYFNEYTPELIDNFKIANTLLNPDKYDFLVLFREKPYPIEKLPKSNRESLVSIEDLIRNMAEDNILTLIKDESGVEWVFLMTDIVIETFYPEYLIEQTRISYEKKRVKRELAIKQLELLEKNYFESEQKVANIKIK